MEYTYSKRDIIQIYSKRNIYMFKKEYIYTYVYIHLQTCQNLTNLSRIYAAFLGRLLQLHAWIKCVYFFNNNFTQI